MALKLLARLQQKRPLRASISTNLRHNASVTHREQRSTANRLHGVFICKGQKRTPNQYSKFGPPPLQVRNMADLSQNLSVRLASHEDYDAVIRMSKDIYGETDYLPAFYHSFIDDPNTRVFIAVLGKQVVGLLVAIITEGGKAFISTSARIAAAWRKTGVLWKLEKYQDAWIRQNYPAARYKRATVSSLNKMADAHSHGLREVFSMPYVEYKAGPHLWWRQDPTQLAQLDTTGLPDVTPLQDPDDDFCTAVQKTLPSQACGGYDGKPIILADWDPFTLCPANLKFLQAENTIYVLSCKGEASLSLSSTYSTAAVRMMSIKFTPWISVHYKSTF
ncbi:histidine N-acetyltransferase-like [Branchiostoma floridae x Branchiostoma japonicum]